MPSVGNLMGLFEKLESRDLTVYQHRCVRVRNRNATCMRCAEACTSGCITYEDNRISVDPANCIGCGTCATMCPTCAIEAHHPTDAELLRTCLAAMKVADGEVVIACDQILAAAEGLFDPQKVVAVANLGRVDETLLVQLARAGASRITLVQPREVGPAEAKGIETAEAVVAAANALLEAWNSDTRARISEKFPAVARRTEEAAFDEARREFFVGMRERTAETAEAAAEFAAGEAPGGASAEPDVFKVLKVMDDGTLPHFIPDRRDHLLDALADLGDPQDVRLNVRLFGHVVIDTDTCISCRMCATFCPTGAIAKFLDDDGATGIEHGPGDCVKCRCCEDICPANALTLADEVLAVDLLSGAVDRYEMGPEEATRTDSHSIVNSMKGLIGIDQIYER